MCDEFWSRRIKEVYATLQARQKWNHVKRNIQARDLVRVRDDSIRNA